MSDQKYPSTETNRLLTHPIFPSFLHGVLVDGTPYRTATHDLEIRNVDGVRLGTTAGQFLDELNAQDDS